MAVDLQPRMRGATPFYELLTTAVSTIAVAGDVRKLRATIGRSEMFVWSQSCCQTNASQCGNCQFVPPPSFLALTPMSSSRSSSSSPEPESIREIVKKSKPKQKKTKEAQDASVVDKHGKNEGDNPNWDYKPPDGFKAMNMKVDEGPFDWDAIKDNDDLELWIVRVPDGVCFTSHVRHCTHLDIACSPIAKA